MKINYKPAGSIKYTELKRPFIKVLVADKKQTSKLKTPNIGLVNTELCLGFIFGEKLLRKKYKIEI